MDVLIRRALAASLFLVLAGCASAPIAARRYLDEQTAATITVGPQWLFARERPDLAVNVRDYLAVHPIDVNRSGEHRTYLVAHAWSTASAGNPPFAAAPRLVLTADDRIITLAAVSTETRALGIGEQVVRPRGAAARVWYYAVEREAIQYISISGSVRAALQLDSAGATYAPWRDPRAAATAFVESIAR